MLHLALEEIVRNTFRALGAQVEDPEDLGKEDGWVTMTINGTVFEGVLEVKSTTKDQFNEDGLRQLYDWKFRGLQNRAKKYKGIFVGLAALEDPLDERPKDPFGANWRKNAALQDVVAIRAEDLYVVYRLNHDGLLDRDEFWRRVFKTNGVLDATVYGQMLSVNDQDESPL